MTALVYKEYKPFIKWVGGKRGLLEQLLLYKFKVKLCI